MRSDGMGRVRSRSLQLALACTAFTSTCYDQAGAGWLYSPSFRQGVFSETELPVCGLLRNSRGFRDFREQKEGLSY
jgi:hypothetical protein